MSASPQTCLGGIGQAGPGVLRLLPVLVLALLSARPTAGQEAEEAPAPILKIGGLTAGPVYSEEGSSLGGALRVARLEGLGFTGGPSCSYSLFAVGAGGESMVAGLVGLDFGFALPLRLRAPHLYAHVGASLAGAFPLPIPVLLGQGGVVMTWPLSETGACRRASRRAAEAAVLPSRWAWGSPSCPAVSAALLFLLLRSPFPISAPISRAHVV